MKEKSLIGIVKKHYSKIEDTKDAKTIEGAQFWNGEWWMPNCGCDTLDHLIDDIDYILKKNKK